MTTIFRKVLKYALSTVSRLLFVLTTLFHEFQYFFPCILHLVHQANRICYKQIPFFTYILPCQAQNYICQYQSPSVCSRNVADRMAYVYIVTGLFKFAKYYLYYLMLHTRVLHVRWQYQTLILKQVSWSPDTCTKSKKPESWSSQGVDGVSNSSGNVAAAALISRYKNKRPYKLVQPLAFIICGERETTRFQLCETCVSAFLFSHPYQLS